MAIEKMALVRIEGALKRVNKTLMKCCESNCFHIITSSKSGDREGENGVRSFKTKNPYTPLVSRSKALAAGLGIEMKRVDYEDINLNVSVDFDNYLEELEERFAKLSLRKQELEETLKDHSSALLQVEKLSGFDVDFSEIFACKYVKIRFGRLPVDSMPKLEYYSDESFICHTFKEENGYAQIFYITPVTEAPEVDSIFNSLFFERIHIPDYFHGDADGAKTEMLKIVRDENTELDLVKIRINDLKNEVEETFQKAASKLAAIEQSYYLRQNVSVVGSKFIMSGYVPKRRLKEFTASLETVQDVEVQVKPLDSEPNSSPPVMLRNCWLFRPFEMFVKMYGLPDYSCFDPTPYVAITYMLMYGIMFGDLGQGLLIVILGIILDKTKHVKLAPIMQRIGISSSVFGILYGSVFGNEEIIEPFFKFPSVYKALGYSSAPADIFQVSTILLIGAIGIGAVLVLISMAMNVITNIKTSHWLSEAVIHPSGIVGMILYGSLMIGAALQLGLGIEMFTMPYVLCLIVLPLILLFLKEPIVSFLTKFVRSNARHEGGNIVRAVKTYSNSVAKLSAVNESTELLKSLNNSIAKAQYGIMEISSYNKISEKIRGNYVFYPFENDNKYVMGVYIAPIKEISDIEKEFAALGFKKMKMPDHVEDIRKEQSLHLSDYMSDVKKQRKSVGNIIIEGFIELFEACLSYVTNTMSFLRVGGFILSHAGMMLVVNVLAGDGGVKYFLVQILGNLFVIGMEGFLVGIQVLRLEFYEIFSRFYKGDGKPFKPIVANLDAEE
ncbi:MAG: ATPase [Firmicutes bacterium]|nr:ATPase [[Eubacterium] siraeum]MCM1487602.1 ATPase [Bacillota bacterium]